MDKNTKIILAVVAAVVVICVCGACATLAVLAAFVPAMTYRAVEQNLPDIQIDPGETFKFELEPGETLEVNPGGLLEGLDQMFLEDPLAIHQLSDEIVEWNLPAGYEPAFGMDFMMMKMAGFDEDNSDKHILVIQFPPEAELDIGKMMLQMKEGNVWGLHGWGQGWWDLDPKEVDRYLMTIRGQEVPVIVSDGGDDTGSPNRSVVTAFEGQNGPVLIVVTTSREAWDQAEVDALLDSIR